jgi:chemotaxis protein MotB
VLLLSLSTIDKKRKRLALNSLIGAFGFKPGGQSILGKEKGVNITTNSPPLVEEDIQFERLRNVALKHGLESELTMSKQLDRTVIVLKNKVLFEHNSSELIKENSKFLSEIIEVLKVGHKLVELRGYCDNSETILEDDPYKSSMILSSKRAITMFDFFVEQGLTPGDIVAHGFGYNYSGASKEASLNRQVEIILDYRERVPYKMRKKRDKGGFLDFKGFFFRKARDMNVK